MISNDIDYFDCQLGCKVYLHSLLMSIWDLLYKAGRLHEEGFNVEHNTYPNKRVVQQALG